MSRTSRRRPGWEVVIAAPKSVSLLAVLASEQPGAAALGSALVRAHRAGALAALEHLQERATYFHNGGRPSTLGMVGAGFSHSANAAGEPHLHEHVVVANLLPADDRWRALDGRRLWWEARAAGAVYSMVVRHHLNRSGFTLAWRPVAGGGAELDAIARPVIEAASSRRAQALTDALRWGTRRAQEVGRRRTRAAAMAAVAGQEWRTRVAEAGLDTAAVAHLAGVARVPGGRFQPQPGPPAPPGPRLGSVGPAPVPRGGVAGSTSPQGVVGEVERRLLAAGSRFRQTDVFPAIAEVALAGASPAQVKRWVAEVCDRASPAGGGTFVSPLAADADRAVTTAAVGRAGAGAGVAAYQLGPGLQQLVDPAARAALRRLVCDGHGVEVLAAPPSQRSDHSGGEAPLLAQAALLDAARQAWEAAGHRVELVAHSAMAAARWEALTGLAAHRPEDPAPTVMIVDRADRMATPQLGALLAGAALDGAKVVLVAGGTSPIRQRPRSAVLEGLAAALGTVIPGPPPELSPPAAPHPASRVLDGWQGAHPSTPRRPLMVAGGAAEVAALNGAARQRLIRDGRLPGAVVSAGSLAVRAGERVIALRRRGFVPAGALGTVALGDGGVTVRWDQRPSEVVGAGGAPLGYGYATTPGYVRAGGPPLLLLGPPRMLASARVLSQPGRLLDAHTAAPHPATEPALDPPGGRAPRTGQRLHRGVGMGIA
jgi:conjugative relaxase-like TrwC/TraI family protein